jgi:DNA-binding NarL/FixJ family response regulator
VENVRILKIKFPGKKIIIYTGGTSSVYSGIMADEGASGYLTKDLPHASLKAAIKKVYEGGTVFPPRVKSTPASEIIEQSEDQFSLSPLPKYALGLLLNGLSMKQISDNMHINRFKTNYLFRQIRKKAGVKDNLQLVIKMLKENISNVK